MDHAAETGFLVRQASFSGTLQELLTALRSGRLPPSELDLLQLVRDWLEHFQGLADRDLDAASEALPRVAQVLELKLRLLLPRQPREQEEELFEEVVEAVEALLDMENAVDFLKTRREDRRLLLPARIGPPDIPRKPRPLLVQAGRLAELAGRLRAANYFELSREGFGIRQAIRLLLSGLRGRKPLFFNELAGAGDWPRATVLFVALLELVRQGSATAAQPEPFGQILVRAGRSTSPPADSIGE